MQRALLNLVSQIPTTIREYQKQKASECCSDILRLFYSSDSVQSCPSSTTRLPHSLTDRSFRSTPHPFRSSLLYTPHRPALLPLHFVSHAPPALTPLPFSRSTHFAPPLHPPSGLRSASSIHSTPSISANTLSGHDSIPSQFSSRPEYRRTTTFKSLRKTKNGEARAANPNPPGRMPITSPPSPVFSTFPNDDSETLCTMSQLLTRNSSLPPDAHGLETLFRTARCLRKGTNNCRVL